MKKYVRSDLACENLEGLFEAKEEGNARTVGKFRIRTVRVREENGGDAGSPCGTYITVECGSITALSGDEEALLIRLIAGELRGLCANASGKAIDSDFCVFVAGLGNAALTADAVGPRTVSKLGITRHLRMDERELYRSIGCCTLCALSPGVLGQTGIETLEILRGAVNHVKPDAVIVVDALAARSCARLAATVQLSDAGISPGSGVGNYRNAITAQTLGVPVVALGVPTVVDSATLVCDALQAADIRWPDAALEEILENGRSFFVSPRESDLITERFAQLLSRSIGTAFAEALDP